jgi:two-component system, OmpR family, response regulator
VSITSVVGICEDDDELRGVLREALEREGLNVRATASGTEAVSSFSADPPDALVLDVGLPDADGRDVCQALRARGVRCPVLFLTAYDSLGDRLSGFRAGGDDYLTKPFALAELVVRVQALLRRRPPVTTTTTTEDDDVGRVHLDLASHAIVNDRRRIALSPTEFRLLAALAAQRGELVHRSALVASGWPDGTLVYENTLDTYLTRLRRKLREAEVMEAIHTRRGAGYVLR